MSYKFFIGVSLLSTLFLGGGCTKMGSVEPKPEIYATMDLHALPTIMDAMAGGREDSISKAIFKDGKLFIAWRTVMYQDIGNGTYKWVENIYEPYPLEKDLMLSDQTKFWVQNNVGNIQLKDGAVFTLSEGQAFLLKDRSIQGAGAATR